MQFTSPARCVLSPRRHGLTPSVPRLGHRKKGQEPQSGKSDRDAATGPVGWRPQKYSTSPAVKTSRPALSPRGTVAPSVASGLGVRSWPQGQLGTHTTPCKTQMPLIRHADRLHAVQERVLRRRTDLDPIREAVTAPAPVVGPQIDRLGRAAFHDVYVDAPTRQRTALEHGGDRRPSLALQGAHLLYTIKYRAGTLPRHVRRRCTDALGWRHDDDDSEAQPPTLVAVLGVAEPSLAGGDSLGGRGELDAGA
jgi:hypothetical protein